ncbi:DUF106 domain-containing protein [Halomarina oriensis]|uniref:DUF106 domain-containing protein n=1 Tax=Halomarina oriensis TaxID=671145 RepID=A0A6B0GHN3_9EURY|nr:EMC3/TMCO1 family protein [Halomarina oriensis]MWG33301.1 DUF106 domain-containing protein [Halomarina oriensis]
MSGPPADDVPADGTVPQAIREYAAEHGSPFTYGDVRDGVDAETWGRLLADGVLVPDGDGFALAGDDGVESWSRADKAAGVAALCLLAGYQVGPVGSFVGSTVDLALGPVQAALPFSVVVLGLAALTATVSLVVRRRLVGDVSPPDGDRMQDLAERLDTARERGDDAVVERLEARRRALVREQLSALKTQCRPLVWTMLVTIPVFLWLSWLVAAPAAAVTPVAPVYPVVGRIVWTARLVGPVQAWMAWYFVCSLLAGTTLRRTVDRVTA